MSRNSLQDQTNIPLIVTTNEGGTARSSTGTSLDSFKAKSCRSFVRQQKLNSESHRNKSVPHNLQVLSYCVAHMLHSFTIFFFFITFEKVNNEKVVKKTNQVREIERETTMLG